MKFLAPGVLAGVLFLGLAAPAQALSLDPPPLGAEGLTGVIDGGGHTVLLTWNPPSGGSVYAYNVYRDGELIAQTKDAWHEESVPTRNAFDVGWVVYHITAVSDTRDVESLPSRPVVIMELPICEPVVFTVKPEESPPVAGDVNEPCVESWKRSIEVLVSLSFGADVPPIIGDDED